MNLLPKIRLGDLLVAKRRITATQRDAALMVQRATGHRLGDVLVEMGALTYDEVADVVAEQLEVARIDLTSEPPDPALVARVGRELIERHQMLPVRVEGDRLILAMVDPLNLQGLEVFRQLHGVDVDRRLCLQQAFDDFCRGM
ncbi:MAG: hypothetical protein ABI743_10855 [bacterium]